LFPPFSNFVGLMPSPSDAPSPRVRLSLRSKLIRTMIGTLSVVAAAVLATVAALHVWTVRDTLSLVEAKIRESIIRKGQGLVANHAQALRGLVADNAFSDVRRLVDGAVREDAELVYGLFLGADGQPWAYVSPTTRASGQGPAAWTELDLAPSVARAVTGRNEHRHLFGREVFEFSAPVRGEDNSVVGAVLYGVSGEPLERALAKARADSRRSLLTAVIVLGLLAMSTMAFGVFLVRKAAGKITQPLAELTRATAVIAAGDRKLQVSIRSGDELEALGDAFNQMVSELNDSYARLEGLNHTLEQRVQERTGELAHRNQELRLVLDTVNEGLLGVTADGALTPERSAMIDRWFGPAPDKGTFVEYISKIDRAYGEAFELGYEALQEAVLPIEVCLAQLPARLRHVDLQFAVSYLPLGSGGPQDGLLVVINDITEQLKLAQQDAEQREQLAAFQGFTRDRSGFITFFDEASQIIQDVASGSLDLVTQKRLVHTLKGNSSLAGLTSITQLCHEIEDELDENRSVQVSPLIHALRNRWTALTDSLRVFFGDRSDAIELSSRELDVLCTELGAGVPVAKVLQRLGGLRFEPVEKPLERLASHARALGQRLGKGDAQVEINGHGLRLDPTRWSPLWSELVHVVRNAVDHGFETPEDRLRAGKPVRPHLRLGAYVRDKELLIEIEDDGRGIDWQAVHHSATELGIIAESEDDLTAALFATGVTSRGKVTSTSGRGVGLAAVYARVQELKGRVTVNTRPGVGTCWRFSFPLSSLAQYEGPGASLEEHVLSGTAVA
jgi:HPt (histidine-containing phosphotransfer) domain-containing protein/HAMP domain-containing protein/two-component sensor histidine kinase